MIAINGTLLEDNQASLTTNNRGFAYGDALFETIRVINGKVMFWEDHYFRLMASMRIMRMEIPMEFSPEFLEQEILTIVEKNGLSGKPARVKLSVYRKAGGLYRPTHRAIEYIIAANALEDPFYTLPEGDYEIELFKDHYTISGLLSTLKTNNRAINVLGSIYAEENDYANCLLLNEKKSVVEALNGNVFLVKGTTLKTPPLEEGCINGIARKKLLEIIKNSPDYEVEEAAISPFELQKADELFLTNVIVGIRPVTQYRKKHYEAKVAKDLLGKLNTMARLG